MDANLIVTFDPAHAGKAKEEVNALLTEVGEKPNFMESGVDGLFFLRVKNSKATVKKVVAECKKNPDKFETTFHWTPVDKWCTSKLEDMSKVLKDIDAKMKPEESWKMDLSKRQYEEDTQNLIIKLTDNINKQKVDLKNPQKIIKVEIIGKKAGIALVDASEALDVSKLKAGK
jgi:tRNA acetyltransferase TAN1